MIADTQTRPNQLVETTIEGNVCTLTIDLSSKDPSCLRIEQLQESKLRKILDCFTTNEPENIGRWTACGYLTSQGVLYRYTLDHEEENVQLVIPFHMKTEILQAHHDVPTAGHYGVESTINYVKKSTI